MSEAIVDYDYVAQKSDELTIKKGDIIKEVVRKQVGWYEGVLHDKRGVFPDNFVRLMDKDGVVYRNKKDSHRQCRVVFSYQPVHPDELPLNIGDIINIVGEDEEGWWKGVLNGREGVFPSNFVEEIFPSKPKIKSDSHEDLPNIINDTEARIPNLPPKPAKILCEVKYAYKAQNEDELTLKEGDIIALTNKELPDPGWWEGELNGKIGVFPDNFVVIIKQADEKSTHNKDDSKHPKANSDFAITKTTATVSQRTSLEPKNEIDAKPNPPLLKKPDLFKKISPSSVTKGFRGFVSTRKSDIVDGVASSKGHQVKNDVKAEIQPEKNGENAFDQVERNPLLKDVRAGRAKPPIRRPPTSAVTTKDKSPNLDSEEIVSSEEEVQETKPSLREWEKHKAPWLEEMKINQAKRSSTSPISEKNLNTKGLYPELDKSPVDGVMSKSMPCPATSKISPIEPLDTKPPTVAKAKPNNLQNLPRNNYSNVDIPLSVNNSFSITPMTTSTRTSLTVTNKFTKNHAEKQSNNNITCNNSSGSGDRPDSHNSRVGGDSAGQEVMVLTVQQYSNLEERLRKLEMVVETQAAAIEELKAKLLIETDRRQLLESQKLT